MGLGDLAQELDLAEGSPVKTALHGVVGALVSLTAGGNVGTGALAGAASKLVNGLLQQVLAADPSLSDDQKSALTQWVATAVGAAVGGQAGAAAALDNVNYNYLNHAEVLALKEATDQCHAGDAGACERAANINAIDQARDSYLHQVCSADGDGDACQAAVLDLRQSLASLYGNNQGLDFVTLRWVELYQRSMGDGLADPSGGKREMLSIISAAMLGGGTTAAKGAATLESSTIKAVSRTETGIVWGKGIQGQGLPW